MADDSKTPLLDKVTDPSDIREYSVAELKQLSAEVRSETIDAVSITGGHLGASLGVVELTVALHHVFKTPTFKYIFFNSFHRINFSFWSNHDENFAYIRTRSQKFFKNNFAKEPCASSYQNVFSAVKILYF